MATITLRVDDEIKRQAEEVFKEIGLGTSAGINIYLTKVAKERAVPFKLEAPKRRIAPEVLAKSPKTKLGVNPETGMPIIPDSASDDAKEWLEYDY
jgi:addiction module RelB/DinJ family antitoxin